MKKKLLTAALVLAVLAVFIWSPLSDYPVSLAVMKVYSGIHEQDNIMEKKGIELHIPGGSATKEKDWYPFVMTFNDDAGFQQFTGESDLKLTILYNFPAFDLLKGCSRVYDPASPYYNGFYGAYLVCREKSGREQSGGNEETSAGANDEILPYGFLADGSLDPEAAAQVPRFDFQKLVLRDLGIEADELVFDWEIVNNQPKVTYLGIDGWTRADARLTVNGMQHQKEDFRRSYLQYGPPGYSLPDARAEADFAPVDMIGRVYGRYFEEWDTSIFFYVLAADQDVLENCDRDILSQSSLR